MVPNRKREWFDDDSFWREFHPYMFAKERIDAARDEVEKAVSLTKPKGKSALDLCCGPGRCSVELARVGYTVTGVDRTRFLLDKARARARAAKLSIEWVQADMREFVRPQSFDLALSMFTSFGYFDDKSDDIQVLRNIFGSLKRGGVCLIEVLGKEILARIFQPTISHLLEDGTTMVKRHEIFDDWTRVRNEWILLRKGRAKTFCFHHTIYSGQELRDRLEQVGFADVKLYGNLEGDAYGYGAERLIAVGRRP